MVETSMSGSGGAPAGQPAGATRPVAGQAGDVVGEDDAHLLLIDQGHQFLEPGPPLGGASGASEVGVNDLNAAGVPAGGTGAVLEVILEFQALLIGQSLMRARLADVDHGEAVEVGGLNGFGCAHGEPP
jgi:hypothetical protein